MAAGQDYGAFPGGEDGGAAFNGHFYTFRIVGDAGEVVEAGAEGGNDRACNRVQKHGIAEVLRGDGGASDAGDEEIAAGEYLEGVGGCADACGCLGGVLMGARPEAFAVAVGNDEPLAGGDVAGGLKAVYADKGGGGQAVLVGDAGEGFAFAHFVMGEYGLGDAWAGPGGLKGGFMNGHGGGKGRGGAGGEDCGRGGFGAQEEFIEGSGIDEDEGDDDGGEGGGAQEDGGAAAGTGGVPGPVREKVPGRRAEDWRGRLTVRLPEDWRCGGGCRRRGGSGTAYRRDEIPWDAAGRPRTSGLRESPSAVSSI